MMERNVNKMLSFRNNRWVEKSQYGQRWDLHRSNSKAKVIEKKNTLLKNVMKIFSLKIMNDLELKKISCITKSATYSNTSYSKMAPGLYPPKVEKRILSKMTEIALNRANEWDLLGSFKILEQVLEVQKSSLGLDHSEVACTLYHIGNILQMSGESEDALSVYCEGFTILFPKRMNEKNIDLASILYQMGYIELKNQNFDVAENYLEQLKQVEIHILGTPNVKTLKILDDVDTGRERYLNSMKELRRSSINALESLNHDNDPRSRYDPQENVRTHDFRTS